jgi:GntR family transcriptional regulator
VANPKGNEMLIVVDPHSGVPVYRQLMDQIRFHISSGLIHPGDELPSTRALSQQLGVNPMTISKAYSFLERDGVVERRPGKPLVVTDFDFGESRERKSERLRESLAPSVTAARQLGIEPKEAVGIFAEMLGRSGGEMPEVRENEVREDNGREDR